MARIQSERENTFCDTLQLDLSSLHSVKEAANKFKQKYRYKGLSTFRMEEKLNLGSSILILFNSTREFLG